MDIKDLNKRQMVLLVLLICFVVSIASAIITVSLMQQVPKSFPQTINRVIERTITNVTASDPAKEDKSVAVGDAKVSVEIFVKKDEIQNTTDSVSVARGVIISDVGLILADSYQINTTDKYQVVLEKEFYDLEIVERYNNGFVILKILSKTQAKDTEKVQENTDKKLEENTNIDNKQ